MVVPLLTGGGELVGVLDIDSPHLSAFSAADVEGLSKIARLLVEKCDWSLLGGELPETEITH